jgi:hypothetical protein
VPQIPMLQMQLWSHLLLLVLLLLLPIQLC